MNEIYIPGSVGEVGRSLRRGRPAGRPGFRPAVHSSSPAIKRKKGFDFKENKKGRKRKQKGKYETFHTGLKQRRKETKGEKKQTNKRDTL